MDEQRELVWLRRVHQHAQRLSEQTTPRGLLARILDSAIAMTEAERGFLVQVVGRKSDGRPKLRVKVARELDGSALERSARHVSRTVVDLVLEGGAGIVTTREEDGHVLEASSVVQRRVLSIICVPMRLRGEPRGVLYLDHRFERGVFLEQDLPILETFAGQAALAMETLALRTDDAVDPGLARTQREIDQLRALPSSDRPRGLGRLVGASPAMCELYQQIERVVRTTHPVLIQGESGAGKELVARELHARGPDPEQPMISFSCGALSDELLESELFGHEPGAFTGASSPREGLFREAGAGTLFLDEVAEMSPLLQKKLLRVLQERRVRPVGSTESHPIACRVVAATHRDLAELVRQGAFRQDLFFRLDVLRLLVPPLRQRAEDVSQLLRLFLERFGAGAAEITEPALARLCAYAWPGNVRQLENEARRLAVSSPERVTVNALSPEIREGRGVSAVEGAHSGKTLDEMTRDMVDAALKQCLGNKARAARQLGVSRSTLYNLLKRYELG